MCTPILILLSSITSYIQLIGRHVIVSRLSLSEVIFDLHAGGNMTINYITVIIGPFFVHAFNIRIHPILPAQTDLYPIWKVGGIPYLKLASAYLLTPTDSNK